MNKIEYLQEKIKELETANKKTFEFENFKAEILTFFRNSKSDVSEFINKAKDIKYMPPLIVGIEFDNFESAIKSLKDLLKRYLSFVEKNIID